MTNNELTLEQLQVVAGGVIHPEFLTRTAARGVIHPSFCEAPERVARLSYAEAVGLDSWQGSFDKMPWAAESQ